MKRNGKKKRNKSAEPYVSTPYAGAFYLDQSQQRMPADSQPHDDPDAAALVVEGLLRLGYPVAVVVPFVERFGKPTHGNPSGVARLVAFHLREGQRKRVVDLLYGAADEARRDRVQVAEREAAMAAGECPPELWALSELFPVRLANALEQAGIETVRELVATCVDDLIAIEGVGRASLACIASQLDAARVRHNFGAVFH